MNCIIKLIWSEEEKFWHSESMDNTKQVKNILSAHGCYFVRQGKGDHENWYSPILNKPFTVFYPVSDKYYNTIQHNNA